MDHLPRETDVPATIWFPRENPKTTTSNGIDLLEHEALQLLDFLQELPKEAWQTASACEAWTIADVVGHLTSVDLSNRLVRGLGGDHSPPEGSPAPEQHEEDAFAQSIYQRGIDASHRLGDGLPDDFTQRINETVVLFRQVQAYASGTTWASELRRAGPAPLATRYTLDRPLAPAPSAAAPCGPC